MKTVIVTGTTGNLGKAIIHKFLAEGHTVIGTTTKKTVTSFDGQPGFEAYAADLSKEDEVASMMAILLKKYPVIDAAVLTAGGFAMGKIAESGVNDLQQQYKLNFETTYIIARLIFQQMIQQKTGRLFFTGSKPGLDMHAGKGMTGYALSKSLIFRLAELMNEEAKGTSVVTHVIVPSTIDTPQNRSSMPDADFSKWVKPESIADIVYEHCSPSFENLREPLIKIYNKA
jgi:NAD(P)-dependent dehydrogenase (short-subunit alcohol dehydrogenase family)